MNKETILRLLSKSKEEFKEHCKKQYFCERCKYNLVSKSKIDCFERFCIDKYDFLTKKHN